MTSFLVRYCWCTLVIIYFDIMLELTQGFIKTIMGSLLSLLCAMMDGNCSSWRLEAYWSMCTSLQFCADLYV